MTSTPTATPAPASSAPASPSTSAPAAAPAAPKGPISFSERIAMARQAKATPAPESQVAPAKTGETDPKMPSVEPPAQVPGKEPAAGQTPSATPHIVEHEGRKFDFSKPEVVAKKLVDLESGMRKFQAERDSLKKELAELKETAPSADKQKTFETFDRAVSLWETVLENALDENNAVARPRTLMAGIDRILSQLIPDQYLSMYMDHQLKKNAHVLSLPPEERNAFLKAVADAEALEHDRLELAQEKRKMSSHAEQVNKKAEQAQQAEFMSMLKPIMREFDMSKSVKNPEIAQVLNQELWRQAHAEMTKRAEAGETLTAESISSIYSALHKRFVDQQQKEVATQVGAEIDRKKEAALSGILDTVATPPAKLSPEEEIKKLYAAGASQVDIMRARAKLMR